MFDRFATQHPIWLLILALMSFATCSCSSRMYAPSDGVTSRFYHDDNWHEVDLGTYDFTRLSGDYGLCIFSFDFVGTTGNAISGFSETGKRGIRVWEHKFADGGWDVKGVDKKILFWGFPSIKYLFLAHAGFDIRTHMMFHRRRIVYGGRIFVTFTGRNDPPPRVGMEFEEDMAAWVQKLSSQVEPVKIDTALIQIY